MRDRALVEDLRAGRGGRDRGLSVRAVRPGGGAPVGRSASAGRARWPRYSAPAGCAGARKRPGCCSRSACSAIRPGSRSRSTASCICSPTARRRRPTRSSSDSIRRACWAWSCWCGIASAGGTGRLPSTRASSRSASGCWRGFTSSSRPHRSSSISTAGRAIQAAYPIGDLILLGMVARLLRGSHVGAAKLVGLDVADAVSRR